MNGLRVLVPALVAFALLAPGAAAGCCEGYCDETHRLSTGETPVGEYYVVEDSMCQPACGPPPPSIWIYQESNGIPGLQRADEVSDETCGGAIPGDTIIF